MTDLLTTELADLRHRQLLAEAASSRRVAARPRPRVLRRHR